uniref:Uncharacterized protein n=1 Tax=Arundo donax TaxID=35708 RepID=A0A0A9BG43_ARUDO
MANNYEIWCIVELQIQNGLRKFNNLLINIKNCLLNLKACLPREQVTIPFLCFKKHNLSD